MTVTRKKCQGKTKVINDRHQINKSQINYLEDTHLKNNPTQTDKNVPGNNQTCRMSAVFHLPCVPP